VITLAGSKTNISTGTCGIHWYRVSHYLFMCSLIVLIWPTNLLKYNGSTREKVDGSHIDVIIAFIELQGHILVSAFLPVINTNGWVKIHCCH